MSNQDNQKKKGVKSISIEPELWESALQKAKRNKQSLSAVIADFLRDWIEGKNKPTGHD